MPRAKLIKLPNYPWQREFLWLENDRAAQDRMNPIVNPILGTQEAPATFAYRNDFDHEIMNYLRDHKVMGLPILPAAGYVESFIELASIIHPDSTALTLRNFEIFAPLIMKDDRGIDFVTTYEPISGMATSRSLDNGKMGTGTTHASAMIGRLETNSSPSIDLKALLSTINQTVDTKGSTSNSTALVCNMVQRFRPSKSYSSRTTRRKRWQNYRFMICRSGCRKSIACTQAC